MAKAIEATCENNVVKVGALTISEPIIFSMGKKSSEGILIIDDAKAYYVASNASDLSTLIESMNEIIQKIIQIATTLDAATLTPGGATANIALLTTLNTELLTSKDMLS